MNPPRHSLPVLALALLSAAMLVAQPARGPAPETGTLAHINALLRLRLRPEPLPVDPPNPFVVTSGLAAAVRTGATPPRDGNGGAVSEQGNSADILAQSASQLRIGGSIRVKDQVHIIINDSPRKEGDAIIVDRAGTAVHLYIVRIDPGRVTIRYQDAEQILRY